MSEVISRIRRSDPVANYVARLSLQQKIKEQLHVPSDDKQNTQILVIYGLGRSGKSQLMYMC